MTDNHVSQDPVQKLRQSTSEGASPLPRTWKENLAYGLFWSWNLIFLAFMVLGFAPRILPQMIDEVRSGLLPAFYLLDGLALSLIPLAAILLGLTVLKGAPDRLFALGYVVEGPLMLLLAVRFFAIRQASPGLDVVFGIALLGMAAFSWHILKPELDRVSRLPGLLKLAGLTLMLLTALYAAVWILFYAIPVGAALVDWAVRTFHNLIHAVIDIRQIWLDLVRESLSLLSLAIFGFALLLYTATLFVLAPVAVPLLSVRAWLSSLHLQLEKWREASRLGWLFPVAAVLLPAAVSAVLFVDSNRQPQLRAFALLQNPPSTPQEAQALLAKQDLIRRGLLNSYLAPFRYISAVGEVSHIKDLYQDPVGLSSKNARKVETLYESVALPLLYEPVEAQSTTNPRDNIAFQREPDEAARLYQQFFDTPIAEGEKSEIVRAARTTWSSDQAEAAWQAVDDREIHLDRQEINISEHGDWADVELYEVYENQTRSNQEVIYYFNLPESSVLTGLWLGTSPDRSLRSAFQVAPRGAAQQIYRQETQRYQDPALLEQIGPRQYRLRVYPVLPATIQWNEDRTRQLSEVSQPMYMWMTYRTLASDGSWPLPRLAFKNNVYWDGSTVRLVNGQTDKEKNENSLSGWMPASVPASSPIQAVSHRVDFPGGQSLLLQPASQVELPGLPAGANLALVLDRSYSMQTHAAQVSEATDRLKSAGQDLNIDVYLTASPYRGEGPSMVSWVNFDPQQTLYFGGQNPAELLAQFEALQAQRSNNQSADRNHPYDGILVLTDGTAYELGNSGQASSPVSIVSSTQSERTIPSAPVWMIHLGSEIPLGYDDKTLEAIQASGGGVVASLDEALSRLALDLASSGRTRVLVDGYVWSLLPSAEAAALAPDLQPVNDGFAALAARQFILAEMRRQKGTISDLATLDQLHALAKEYGIVTPYSSMIVLVNLQQQATLKSLEVQGDRYQREYENLTNTTPTPQAPLVGVPEPQEWLLMGVAVLVLGWYYYQKRLAPQRQVSRIENIR